MTPLASPEVGTPGRVAVIAPAPPPVTGQSSYYPYLEKVLASENFKFYPLRTRDWREGIQGHVKKALRALRIVGALAVGPAPMSALLVVDAGPGLIWNIAIAAVLRARGVRTFISHHSFKYLHRPSRLMATLVSVCGRRATHVMLCYCMLESFVRRYPCGRVLQLNNARRVALDEAVGTYANGPDQFAIGYISNVSFEKGIREFVAVLENATAAGGRVKGLVAGPAASREVETFLQAKVAELSGRLDWVGPVYGEKKRDFFRRVSVLVFPTKYEVEAQPNVLFEALSYGAPTITTNLGCISEDMAGSGSLVCDREADFVRAATDKVMEFVGAFEAGAWDTIAQTARERFLEVRDIALGEEQELIRRMLATSAH